ncbi:hypothetical protein A9993_01465 [Rahnella victoriana]|jgi:hypothetical protein|nr:hypothetical protein A9993_01465 [Rahnella victoriana]
MSERNKRSDRTDAQIKVSALIAVAVECEQIQTNTDKQEQNERNDPPGIENRLFQFDGRSLWVYTASIRAQWRCPTYDRTEGHSTTKILNNNITKSRLSDA